MQRYFDVVQNRQGTAVVGATVTVYDANGNLATLYSNNSGAASSNPVYTNSDGEYAFYAANGTYSITIAQAGYATETKPGVVLFDPSDSSASNNVQFLQAGIGAQVRSVQSKLRETVSVLDFGASPSASAAANTAAIQAALDTGYGVLFPDGDYTISSNLTVSTAGQKLVFESRNARLVCNAEFDALTINASFVEITNGTLIGVSTSGLAATNSGLRIQNCTRGLFQFMRIEGFGYGIRMQGAAAAFVNNFISCYIYNNKRAGFYGCGNATSIYGGEIAGSVYGIMQAALQTGSALAVNRDSTGVLGQQVAVYGTTIEGIGNTPYTITGVADNGSGLIRVTVSNHGFSTQDYVSIHGVTGTTEANGVWPITVIDANTFDLKTSVFANAYVSGGSARRGAGIYVGVGQVGVRVSGCYFEEVPVIYHAGDSFRNDGTTAHSTIVTGMVLENCYIGNVFNASFAVLNRVDSVNISGNYASGTLTALTNNRGSNYNGSSATAVYGNYGFIRPFETTGTQAQANLTIDPVSKNGAKVLVVRVPTSSANPSLVTAMEIEGYSDSTQNVSFSQTIRVLGALRRASSVNMLVGTGSPEGAAAAVVGSIYQRIDGGAGTTLYVKESGTGNTGWVAK